jgi:hypothetical protein
LLGRLRGLFRRHRDNGCDPCAPCCNLPPVCAPPPSCAPPCDDSCGCDNGRHGLRHRLRGLFRRHRDNGCDPCCDPCAGAVVVPGHGHVHPPKGEPIPPPKDGAPPKKMPEGKDGGAAPIKNGNGSGQINLVPAVPGPISAPALQGAPALVPQPIPAPPSGRRDF